MRRTKSLSSEGSTFWVLASPLALVWPLLIFADMFEASLTSFSRFPAKKHKQIRRLRKHRMQLCSSPSHFAFRDRQLVHAF